jgi:hypothetical protein
VISSITLDRNIDMKDVVDDCKIPAIYHEFLSIILLSVSDLLPLYHLVDHIIKQKNTEELLWTLIYVCSKTEPTMLRKYLKEILLTEKIRPSKSLARVSILFIPKTHSHDLYLSVTYHGFNRIIVLNRYPLPLMNELYN